MEKTNKKDDFKPKGRWSMLSPVNGTLHELKASTAKLRSEVKRERSIFLNYSLADGGKKINHI